MLMNRNDIYQSFFLMLFFAITFSGDYYVNGLNIYLFFLFIPFFLFMFIFKKKVDLKNIILACIFCLISSPAIIGVVYKEIAESYYFSFFFIFMMILILNEFFSIYSSPNKYIGILCVVITFSFFILLVIVTTGARSYFIFGPTILYRIYLLFYAISAIYLLSNKSYSVFIILSFIALLSVIVIGSRGGIVVILSMWVVILFKYFSIRFQCVVFTSLIIISTLLFKFTTIFSSRAFYFSLSSESSNVRLDKLKLIYDFFDYNTFEVLFGLNSPHVLVGKYPHNILVEILIFHGLIYFVIFIILFVFYIIYPMVSKNIRNTNMFILTLPIVIGSQFSGRLLDNYFSISAIYYLGVFFMIELYKNIRESKI